jgi:phosphoglycolate phosphatase
LITSIHVSECYPVPRTLLLDLDGTLVDTVPDLESALNRLMASRDLAPFGRAEVAAMVGDGVPALIGKAFAARGGTQGRVPDAAAVTDFIADYEAHVAEASRSYPGVNETLARLAAQGWGLAVCTNKPERAARTLLEAVGLAELLTVVGGGDSFPFRKPDPAHVLATLAMVAGRADAAALVGDHRNDVVAASGAGVACIFAAWGYGGAGMEEGASAVAADFVEAAAVAERLVVE